ncbi:MAG: autotransporter outer membrane beta-barrel domain-containing protein [Rhodanobacteraceae bacterium]
MTNNGTVISQGTKAAQGLTITGNLTEGTSSTTAVALGDPLAVKGTASLNGTMEVLGAPSGYTVKSTEPLVNAGTLSGTFGTLTFASGVFYTGTLAYTPTQVNVALTQTSVTATALGAPLASPQTVHAAENLQGALDVSNQWLTRGQMAGHAAWGQAAGAFLSAPTLASAVTSLNSLSGEIYGTGRAVESELALATDQAIAHRQNALAQGQGAGVWVLGTGTSGMLEGSGYDSADYRSAGTLAGIDGSFGSFSAGIAGGRTRVDSHIGALGGDVEGREDLLAAYARANLSDGGYLAGRVGYAHVRNEINRSLLLGTTLTPISGAHTDHLTLASLEGGKTLGHWTPYVSLSALRIDQSAFAENGANGMGLAAPSQTHTASFADLGLRYGDAFQWSGGQSWFGAYADYRRVLGGANLGIDASFVGVPDSTFVAEGQNLPRNTGILGAEFSTQVNARWGWFLDGDYQTANGGGHAGEVDAGVRLAF